MSTPDPGGATEPGPGRADRPNPRPPGPFKMAGWTRRQQARDVFGWTATIGMWKGLVGCRLPRAAAEVEESGTAARLDREAAGREGPTHA